MNAGGGSLRRRLTISLVSIVGAALAGLSITLYVLYSRGSRDRFDERLADAARAAAMMVEPHEQRPWTLAAAALATLDQSRGATSYEVWLGDGSVLARFPPAKDDLPRPSPGASPRLTWIGLPGGRTGRLYQAWVELRPRDPAGRRVAVAVARDSEQLDRRLSRLRLILFVPTLGVVVLAAAVVSLTIRRSLRHVERLSASIASIDASSLRERLLLHGLPDELKPPFVKLNELLSRIEGSLARERQFNADVSHELRTPLAGLRTILEVSASRDRSAADYRAGLTEALEVVGQVEAIVENLILLARLGSGQITADSREEIRLGDLVRSCFAPYAETSQRRGLTFENRIPPEVTLPSDRVKLRLVLTNLLSNAAEYTAEGGWIAVESDPTRGLVLAVRDSGPAIPEEAVARLFDPFFRLDSARSGNGEHYGIGLALVRGLCDTLGYRVSVQNEASGAVAFTVMRATDGR